MIRKLACCVFLSVLSLWSQSNVGSITGSVTDTSQAPVTDCQVTATSLQTGQQLTVQTLDSGLYTFASLPAGTYNISVQKSGFKQSSVQGVVLDAASSRTVNFSLQLGTVNETVTVSAESDQIQNTSGDVGRLLSERQLSQIALNGRNYSQLLQLIPGAVSNVLDPLSLNLSTTGENINGIPSTSLLFTIDGNENMDDAGNTNASVQPSADAIAEVKILTASYSAQFGGRSGAMVNVVVKTGTKDFHGSAFEFVRNSDFDARSFFAQSVNPLHFNDFGFTIGGPAYIPKKWNTQKDKLFFFGSQEWRYTHLGATQVNTVPTVAERNGNFQNSGLPAPIDPTNGQPFANEIVPVSRFSYNGPRLLTPYPLPNFSGAGGNYSVSAVSKTDPRDLIIRLDYLISQNTQVSYKLTKDAWYIYNAYQGSNLGTNPGTRPRSPYVTSASINHTFSPTALNVFSFAVTYDFIQATTNNTSIARSTTGVDFPEVLAINGNGGEFQLGPNVSISGFTGYTAGDRIRHANAIFELRDDYTKVIGSHSIKIGGQFFRSRTNENVNSGETDNGVATFNTSALHSSKDALADVLLGNFQTYTEAPGNAFYYGRFTEADGYVQDSWKVNKKLNIELGVRYNFMPPFYNALGNTSAFSPSAYNPALAPTVNPTIGSLVPGTGNPYNGIVLLGSGFQDAAKGRLPQITNPALANLFGGLSRSGRQTNYGDWGPRFGFSYDPFGKGTTSVRGGYGIFYDRLATNLLGQSSANPPFFTQASVFDGNIDNPGGATATSFPTNLTYFPVHFNDPSVQSYNFGVQQQGLGGIILDVAYVGNIGRHLLRTLNINQLPVGTRLTAPNSNTNVNALVPYLGYGTINMFDNSVDSSYNSLQVTASRRISRGFSFTFNYTFSKTMDDSTAPQNVYNARADYALSNINHAQVFSATYIYELPFFRTSRNGLLKNSLGGWELAGVTRGQTGGPFSVIVPVDVAKIGVSQSRATVIADPNLPADQRTASHWFNTAAFLPASQMVQGQFGNSGRNILTGPGFVLSDLSLLKNFSIHERAHLQFRAESFNFLNHPSFTTLNTTVNFSATGQPTQNFGQVTGAGPGRVIELGLKLTF
jgi:hypothetical protein